MTFIWMNNWIGTFNIFCLLTRTVEKKIEILINLILIYYLGKNIGGHFEPKKIQNLTNITIKLITSAGTYLLNSIQEFLIA